MMDIEKEAARSMLKQPTLNITRNTFENIDEDWQPKVNCNCLRSFDFSPIAYLAIGYQNFPGCLRKVQGGERKNVCCWQGDLLQHGTHWIWQF